MDHHCIGCGICAGICPQGAIRMAFSERLGSFEVFGGSDFCQTPCSLCDRICPFEPNNPSTEEITRDLFVATPGIEYDPVLGYYLGCFVGYSEPHRKNSASGGLLTRVLETLIERGDIDKALCVGADLDAPTKFSFRICRTVEEVRSCSGSCYQPVEISGAVRHVLKHDGRYAVVALPCMARGLRLAMRANTKLRDRIIFIMGLTCGQVKNRRFVEYLAWQHFRKDLPHRIYFRRKAEGRPANDFAFEFSWEYGDIQRIHWSEGINTPWCHRWFTLAACDYCDDVFAECADAVFMDAWLKGYISDGKGHTITVLRHPVLKRLVDEQAAIGHIDCAPIATGKVLMSQNGVIHQKRRLASMHAANAAGNLRIPSLRACGSAGILLTVEARLKRKVRSLTDLIEPGLANKNGALYRHLEIRLAWMTILIDVIDFFNRGMRWLWRKMEAK